MSRRRCGLSLSQTVDEMAPAFTRRAPDVSLAIPAHNEAQNIGGVLRTSRDVLQAVAPDYEIVLVDDASTDGTAAVAREALGADSARLRVLRHERQRGYAVTVCDGLRASRGKVLAFMDGDGQFDPADLAALLAHTRESDLVAGYRAQRADPWYRSFVASVYSVVVRLVFGIAQRDPDCGLKVMRRSAYESVAPIHATSAVFNPEIFFKAMRLGLRVEQLPVRHLPRRAGKRSGGRLVPVLRAMRDVFRLRLWLALRWRAAPRRPAGRWRALPWVLPGMLSLVVLRLPSLFEPHWYTDEASYVSTARTLLRGHVLYSQIWSNKPPLQLWTIAGVVGIFGSSELALHLLTLISGLLTVGAVAWAANRLLGRQRAAVAALFAGVVLGLPVLDAELAIPESLIIAPLSWAGALLAVRLYTAPRKTAVGQRIPRWPLGLGVLTAVAIAYQQTAVAEACAFGLAIAISPRTGRRELLTYAATTLAITAAWVGTAVATAGASKVAFGLVGFYVAYTQSVLPASSAGSALHFAQVVFAVALMAAGAFLRRKSTNPAWFFVLWAGASLSVAAVAGQPYAHYLAPAVAPVALTLATLPISLRRIAFALRPRSSWRVAPQVAGLGIVAAMASVAGLDWVPAAAASPLINQTRTLQQYYGGAVTSALHMSDPIDWDNDFDWRIGADTAVADWLKSEGLSGTSAVVWSSDSWVYALADLPVLMPTPPIYNDEVLLGINGEVETYVENLRPAVIVVAYDAEQQFPEIQKLLVSDQYKREFISDPETVWVRADVAAALP